MKENNSIKNHLFRTGIMFRRNWRLFLGKKVILWSSLLIPPLVTLLILEVSDHDFYGKVFEDTRTTLFTIISAAIYVGMFNSLGLVCKEREVIKREFVTGLSRTDYMVSQSLTQFLICGYQAIATVVVIDHAPDARLSLHPVTGLPGIAEFFITFWLIYFMADMMGLLVSTVARSAEKANFAAPIIIVAQLVFGNVLFALDSSLTKFIAFFTVSEHGMNAVGVTAGLNQMDMRIQHQKNGSQIAEMFPQMLKKDSAITDAYRHTVHQLMTQWGTMAALSILMIIASILLMGLIRREKR